MKLLIACSEFRPGVEEKTALQGTKVLNDYLVIVKLREREGQRVDLGRSLKGPLWMVDGDIPFPDALH